jgi:hypothetical protein
MWKIKLTLEGGMIHTLNDVRTDSPGWSECYPGKIEQLNFSFLGKDPNTLKENQYDLCLSGMDEYNFFVEASRSLLNNSIRILGFWFLGKILKENKVVGFVIKDRVFEINTINGIEYSGCASSGWKPGIPNSKIIFDIARR